MVSMAGVVATVATPAMAEVASTSSLAVTVARVVSVATPASVARAATRVQSPQAAVRLVATEAPAELVVLAALRSTGQRHRQVQAALAVRAATALTASQEQQPPLAVTASMEPLVELVVPVVLVAAGPTVELPAVLAAMAVGAVLAATPGR
jgi:hypothetical protein